MPDPLLHPLLLVKGYLVTGQPTLPREWEPAVSWGDRVGGWGRTALYLVSQGLYIGKTTGPSSRPDHFTLRSLTSSREVKGACVGIRATF